MDAVELSELLNSLGACRAARKWSQGKSLQQAWNTCNRGDWLLWLCGRMTDRPGWPSHKDVVLAACDCAELSLKYVPEEKKRPRKCIKTVRAWVAGTATIKDVRSARNGAFAAHAADYSDYSASYAAASYAASYAAYAADAARIKTLVKCADLVRARLSIRSVK